MYPFKKMLYFSFNTFQKEWRYVDMYDSFLTWEIVLLTPIRIEK